MKHWTDNIEKKECTHTLPANGRENPPSAISDFSYYATPQSFRKTKHHYCTLCKGHWWDGRFWTREEWETYINAEDEKDEY